MIPHAFAIGDVHGHLDKLINVLQSHRLLDFSLCWAGGNSRLWFLGDFFDRGPSGVGVIELIMRLQQEARQEGGFVGALLGNHEPLILGARKFRRQKTSFGMSFRAEWLHNGGRLSDLEALNEDHLNWLLSLPAMALEGDYLLIHADSQFYFDYGNTILEVNHHIHEILVGDNDHEWDELLAQFSRRREFLHSEEGEHRVDDFLRAFGGKRVVHGHTPIPYLRGVPADEVCEAYFYAGGRVINIDGGLIYREGNGFVFPLRPLNTELEVQNFEAQSVTVSVDLPESPPLLEETLEKTLIETLEKTFVETFVETLEPIQVEVIPLELNTLEPSVAEGLETKTVVKSKRKRKSNRKKSE